MFTDFCSVSVVSLARFGEAIAGLFRSVSPVEVTSISKLPRPIRARSDLRQTYY